MDLEQKVEALMLYTINRNYRIRNAADQRFADDETQIEVLDHAFYDLITEGYTYAFSRETDYQLELERHKKEKAVWSLLNGAERIWRYLDYPKDVKIELAYQNERVEMSNWTLRYTFESMFEKAGVREQYEHFSFPSGGIWNVVDIKSKGVYLRIEKVIKLDWDSTDEEVQNLLDE